MFTADQSPDRVQATPAAAAHLGSLAAQGHDVVVLLSDERAAVVPRTAPAGRLFLGEVQGVPCMADASSEIPWWRSRAVIDLRGDTGVQHDRRDLSYELTELTEAEVFAALASGPLPRY